MSLRQNSLSRNHCCSKLICLCFLTLMIVASDVAKAVVDSCSEKCICLSESKVLCNGGGLSEIPKDLPEEVEHLSFARNELDTLTKEMFSHWRRLTTLNLDANRIHVLHPFIFKGLPLLKELSIQKNPMTELTQFSFSGIENISQIDLRNNKIETLHPYVFAGSRNIAMLFLQGNPIIRIKSRAFSGLRMVQFLYLPSWIKVIEADSFYDLQGLGLLRLHGIHLHSLRPYTFRGLRNVTQISIRESDLGVLTTLAFAGMTNIGELRIMNNKVDQLETLTVTEQSNVDGVVVQGNHFLTIKDEGNILDLEPNERSVVIENFFPCNCQLRWVVSSTVALRTPLFGNHNYCVSPYSLHGKTIDCVNISQLDSCLEPQEFQGASNYESFSGAQQFQANTINENLFWLFEFSLALVINLV